MSTVKCNDITNVSGGIPTVKGQKLIPTAWVNFNGTSTVAIRDSENVSSITDNGPGYYTVNFATTMSDTNYISVGTAGGTGTNTLMNLSQYYSSAPTTTSCPLNIVWQNGTNADPVYVGVTILGGQA